MNTRVRTYLIELCRQRTNQTVTYQNLSDACNLQLTMQENPHDRKIMGSILGEISTFEHSHGRPLLSALVLRSGDNYEGDGFYRLAETLGFGDWRRLKADGVFEIMQINECIARWTSNAYYAQHR